MKKLIKILINIILTLILIFSCFSIYIKLSEYKKADKVYTDIRENIQKENQNKDKYQQLYNKNKDYRFWIKINNTNIDYPVVQGSDNEFYLTHDFYKNPLSSGSIFMDYRNNFEKDNCVILYGHHMKNKTMFGDLVQFKTESFFKENNLIEIEYKGKTYTYEVFSVYVADLNNEDYLKIDFNADNEFKEYLNYITEKSMYKSDISIDTSDKIITLYTCSYEFKDARTIVHAKLI
nr:class B sortase [uncultured Romboutsia sp.]